MCEAVFLGKIFLIGHKQRHPILAQLLVSHNGILRIEIFLWASDNFFGTLYWKIRFLSKSNLFSQVGPTLTTKIPNWAQAETPNLCQLPQLWHNNWEMQMFGWAFRLLWHALTRKMLFFSLVGQSSRIEISE